jgi:hypothetical protein
MGYHVTKIPKGQLGQSSKITEEYLEFLDAHKQGNLVMEMIELSDLMGAIEAYTMQRYNIHLDHLMVMTRATQRAFNDGERK